MRRVVAILNPTSDRGRTAALAASLRDALASRLEVVLRETTCSGQAAHLATEAGGEGCDAVIAIGGDGTVHETANGLMAIPADRRPAMGVIPAGSGNDVAYALGIGTDWQRTIQLIERGDARSVDLAQVRASGRGTCYAINNVGALLEGTINLLSHQYAWPRGSGLYVRAMLQTLMRPIPVAQLKLAIDGVQSQRPAIMLSIANGPRSGGRFLLAPEADPCDGRLNYVMAAPAGRLALLRKAATALWGGSPADCWIERGTFRHMHFRSSLPLAAHVDGEPWLRPQDGCTELAIEVVPGALRVICGRGR